MGQKALFVLEVFLGAGIALAQPNVTAWNILVDGVHDNNLDKRRQAITALGAAGETPDTVKLLEQALRDDNVLIRTTAAAVMGQMKCQACIPYLRAELDDESGEAAFAAAKALWDIGDHSGKFIIQDVLTGERKNAPGFLESKEREASATLHSPKKLTMMGVKEASGALLGPFGIGIMAAEEAMKDGNATGRTLSAAMLAQDCDARALQLLEWDLQNDKNWAVRVADAKAIAQCGNPEAVPVLEQALSDSHAAVRYMAAGAILRLSPKKPNVGTTVTTTSAKEPNAGSSAPARLESTTEPKASSMPSAAAKDPGASTTTRTAAVQ